MGGSCTCNIISLCEVVLFHSMIESPKFYYMFSVNFMFQCMSSEICNPNVEI